uniref:(California timema) hypothetical protein n=2 Tax=Timema TaxID=61471 RepID=A0A7R9JIZ8_TIMCA|nr:unnamed protein product [Timema californicum]
MQSAMNHAATQALTSMLFAPSQTHSISAFLQLFVDRNNLVQDTIRELTKYNTSELKKPLKVVTLTFTTTSTRSGDPTVQQVTFLGEEAVDAGGVTKEFFMLLLREILDPKYGMFRYHEETRTMWFSEDSFEDEIMYYLVGLVCGLAIYNFTIINMPFPLALYKKLLSEPVSLQDLKGLSPTLAK